LDSHDLVDLIMSPALWLITWYVFASSRTT